MAYKKNRSKARSAYETYSAYYDKLSNNHILNKKLSEKAFTLTYESMKQELKAQGKKTSDLAKKVAREQNKEDLNSFYEHYQVHYEQWENEVIKRITETGLDYKVILNNDPVLKRFYDELTNDGKMFTVKQVAKKGVENVAALLDSFMSASWYQPT